MWVQSTTLQLELYSSQQRETTLQQGNGCIN